MALVVQQFDALSAKKEYIYPSKANKTILTKNNNTNKYSGSFNDDEYLDIIERMYVPNNRKSFVPVLPRNKPNLSFLLARTDTF